MPCPVILPHRAQENMMGPERTRGLARGAGESRLLSLALMPPADGVSPAEPGPVSVRLPPII